MTISSAPCLTTMPREIMMTSLYHIFGEAQYFISRSPYQCRAVRREGKMSPQYVAQVQRLIAKLLFINRLKPEQVVRWHYSVP